MGTRPSRRRDVPLTASIESAQGLPRAHEIAAAPGVSLGDDEVRRRVDDAFRVPALQSRHEQEPG